MVIWVAAFIIAVVWRIRYFLSRLLRFIWQILFNPIIQIISAFVRFHLPDKGEPTVEKSTSNPLLSAGITFGLVCGDRKSVV